MDALNHAEVEGQDPTAPDFLADCRLMLRFILKEALPIPPEVRRDIAEFDIWLVAHKQAPMSSVSKSFVAGIEEDEIKPPPPAAAPAPVLPAAAPPAAADSGAPAVAPTPTPSERLLKIHEALSRIIAPATPLSLAVSEPAPGRRRMLGGTPLIVQLAAICALVSAGGFIFSTAVLAARATRAQQAQQAIQKPVEPPPKAPLENGAPAGEVK